MKSANVPENEDHRLDALFRYDILDTPNERSYDDLVSLAAAICGKPIALVSLVDNHRQWFKAKFGLEASETPKDVAFCSHALLQKDVFVVENALEDERFSDNPLVVNAPNVIFYAGAPLITPDGHGLGTLCVIDNKPGSITEEQKQALKTLANQVISLLELKRQNKKAIEANQEKRLLIRLLAQEIRTNFNTITSSTKLIKKRLPEDASAGLQMLVRSIDECAKHSNTIVDRAVLWSRLRNFNSNKHESNGKHTKNEKITTDVASVVQNACEREQSTALSQNVSIAFNCDQACYAEVDPVLLASVVQNLVQNAVKYSAENGKVDVGVLKKEQSVTLSVKDNGKGISESRIESLFFNKELHKIEESDTVGMGCLLAQEFVKRFKGELNVESSPDSGTTVIITLPLSE